MRANSRAFVGGGDPPADDAVSGLGGTYAVELAGMVDHAFCFSTTYGAQQHRAERFKAQPALLEFERKLVKRARKLGIPLFAHCVNRGSDEQNRHYVKGVTKARAGESPHNFGCAVDLVHGTKGWGLTQKQWAVIGHIGKEVAASLPVDVTWGGDWKFYDPAHWELTDWRDIRDLLSASGLY